MKKLFVIGGMVLGLVSMTACNKNNGCPNNSEKARIRDFTDSTACDWIIQLDSDNTKLQPTNLSEYPFLNLEENQLVWIKYKETSGASQCDLNQTVVKIKCISEREF